MRQGSLVWFMDGNRKRMAVIIRVNKTDATIRFADGDGGIRISVNRLFRSEREIDEYIRQHVKPTQRKIQYDYM